MVSWPWPWLCVPVKTVTLPVGCTRISRDLVQAGAGAERADHRRGRDAAGFEVGGDADAAQLAVRAAAACGALRSRPNRRAFSATSSVAW